MAPFVLHMTDWILLTNAAVTALLTPAQAETVATGAPLSGEADPVATSLAEAVTRARLVAASGPGPALSPHTGRIAPELRSAVAYLALDYLSRRIAGLYLSAAQQAAIAAAHADLTKVRTGELRLTPASDAPQPPSVPVGSIELTTRRRDRLTGKRLSQL